MTNLLLIICHFRKPRPAPVTEEIRKVASNLPSSFDWRNVNGQNFVTPVRDQGACGSCYAFGSLGMIEARLRIATNNTKTTILSTQDIVSCSEYSQGWSSFSYLSYSLLRNLKGFEYFLYDTKHKTLNLHGLKIMMVESFSENITCWGAVFF